MEFHEFEREASRVWADIPDTYRAGVDALVVERKSQSHPSMEDIYTLGECRTESYPSDWAGPETTRSILALYYGSFVRVSEQDPDFDWEYEVWETITHELRHHLESLASEDALEGVDYAMDENFKRFRGDAFDPFFYRAGEPVEPGVWQVERDLFLELEYEGSAGRAVEFELGGRRFQAPVPAETGDVMLLQVVDGLDAEDLEPELELCLVLVRRHGLMAGVARWLRRNPPGVVQAEVTVERIDPREGP
jgi:hypothetical protein